MCKVGDIVVLEGKRVRVCDHDLGDCRKCVFFQSKCPRTLYNKRECQCGGDFYFKTKENEMGFTKKDLRDGDIVTYRDANEIGQYVVDRLNFVCDTGGRVPLTSIEDDLTCDHNHEYDIIKVTRPEQVVFTRKEEPSIQIDVLLNGKAAKLSDISEETLLKLREL